MLIVFIFGGVPSNCTVPEIDPAVAASTGTPAGALAGAGASDVSCLFPQPDSAKGKSVERAAK